MADKGKTIYDIERCISHVPDACRDCSKYGTWDAMVCMEELLSDALELLKEQDPHELTVEEWQTWKKDPKRDPICMVYYMDFTPFWILNPDNVDEVQYYMGKIKLFTKKPEKRQVKWE